MLCPPGREGRRRRVQRARQKLLPPKKKARRDGVGASAHEQVPRARAQGGAGRTSIIGILAITCVASFIGILAITCVGVLSNPKELADFAWGPPAVLHPADTELASASLADDPADLLNGAQGEWRPRRALQDAELAQLYPPLGGDVPPPAQCPPAGAEKASAAVALMVQQRVSIAQTGILGRTQMQVERVLFPPVLRDLVLVIVGTDGNPDNRGRVAHGGLLERAWRTVMVATPRLVGYVTYYVTCSSYK